MEMKPTKVTQKTKNVDLEKVFGANHPQTLRLLSRRGPRCLVSRLSQHYIGLNEGLNDCHYSKTIFMMDSKD